MEVNEIIKGLKVHMFSGNCDDCPLKDDEYCYDNLIEAVIRVLEEREDG